MHNDDAPHLERRNFLKRLGLAGAAWLAGGTVRAADEPAKTGATEAPPPVPRRKFGRHDFTVSSLCLGGHTLRLATDEEAAKIVDAAFAAGVNFFDNCWDYHQGRAEELLGKLLVGRRNQAFVMTKVCSNHLGGGRVRAMQMLDDSLRRLRTDHLDLWQLHELASMEQVESAYAPGGTLEALVDAKKQGKVRFIGFTGHSDPAVHLAMLGRGFEFDSCQFPVNALNYRVGREFREKVLPEVVRQGIAPLAMKTMSGDGAPIRDGKLTADEALRYALTTPVAAVVSGIQRTTEFQQNAKIAAAFVPMSPEHKVSLENRFLEEQDGESPRFAYYACQGYRDGCRPA